MVREAVAYIDHRATVYIGTNSMEFEECVEFSNLLWMQGQTVLW